MAVNNVYQREIVEVPFVFPDGKVLPHPAFVDAFNVSDVVSRHNCFLRQPYFVQLVDKIVANIVDGDF
jgi:hypothetical protein